MLKIYYNNEHETSRNQSTVGNPKTSGNRHVEGREDVSVCRISIKRFIKFGGAMVPNPSETRTEWIKTETYSRTPCPIVRFKEEKVETPTYQRSGRRWVRYQHLDSQAYRRAYPETLWCPLSPGTRLEADVERLKLELSKTRTTGHSTRRESNCSLENADLARYKKKPGNLRHIWRFLTRAVSCSFPMSEKRGLQLGKHQFYNTVTSVTKYPLFPVSQFHHDSIAWDSTFNFIPRTLPAWKSFNTFDFCFDTYKDTWFFYGMAERYTAVKSLQILFCTRKNFTFTGSPLMHLNLTQMNSSGVRQNALCPMLHQRIYRNLIFLYADRSGILKNRSLCFALAYMPRNYHGNKNKCIHYLCEGQ